ERWDGARVRHQRQKTTNVARMPAAVTRRPRSARGADLVYPPVPALLAQGEGHGVGRFRPPVARLAHPASAREGDAGAGDGDVLVLERELPRAVLVEDPAEDHLELAGAVGARTLHDVFEVDAHLRVGGEGGAQRRRVAAAERGLD